MDNKKELNLYAWEFNHQERSHIVVNSQATIVNYFFYDEIEVSLQEDEVTYLNQPNVKVNFLTIDPDTNRQKKLLYDLGLRKDENSVNVYSFPEYWFLKTHYHLLNENKYYHFLEKKSLSANFKYPFLSFNGRLRDFRCQFIDHLSKNNLLNAGVVSFHTDNVCTYDWKYYNGEKLSINDGFDEHGSSYNFNEKFLQSFLHIPTETSIISSCISEKTITPLLIGLPFLVLGPPKFHTQLKNLGFKLYDELFDYSFDDEENLDIRIEKLIHNIKFVVRNGHRLNELYNMIKEKVQYNKNHARNIVRSIECVPDILKQHYYSLVQTDSAKYSNEKTLIKIFNHFEDVENVDPNIFKDKMYRKYYDYASNFSYKNIIDDIVTFDLEEVVIFGESEWETWATSEFIELVNSKNIKVLYTTIAENTRYIKNLPINRLEIQTWPTFYFRFSTNKILNVQRKPVELEVPFICLNNRAHLHRCYVIDCIAKYNLLDTGVVSWLDPLMEANARKRDKGLQFEYFDEQPRFLNDSMKELQDSYILPEQYHSSLFDFVTECCHETIAISEKTVKPLVLKKPFVVMGAVGFNTYLKHLGFELYDEIIDYGFDNELDLKKRAEMYVSNIKTVSKIENLQEVYEMLLPKINHNFNKCIEWSVDVDNIPPVVKQVLSVATTNPFVEELGCLAKYKYLFGA